MDSKIFNAFPAYGRRYATSEDLLKDWNDGKDFKVCDGPYFGKNEKELIKADGFTAIRIFYSAFSQQSYVIDL